MAEKLHNDVKRGNTDLKIDRALAEVQKAMISLREAEIALQGAISTEDRKGSRGCTWDKQNNSWKVRASVNGRMVNVGNYRRLKDAKAAYESAKKSAPRD